MSALEARVFQEAANRVSAWKRPLLVSHTIPDGDALGSLATMRLLLRSQGVEAIAVVFDAISNRYAIFQRFDPMPVWGKDIGESGVSDVDAVILLDTCAYSQLTPMADWLRATKLPRIAVDHHITRDVEAELYVIDESAAANCLILYEWARAVGWPITKETAEAMFIGMAMDTGWFRHANTDRRVLAASAELVDRGANTHELFEQLFLRETHGRVRLLGAALGTLELLADDRLAVMVLEAEAFPRVGATYVDTEDIVNEPLRINTVVVSVLLVDRGDGLIRASFRSKPPLNHGMPDVDVAAVAQTFGGGGHRNAAGARVTGKLAEVRTSIASHLKAELAGFGEPPG